MDNLIRRQDAIDAIKEFKHGATEWRDEQEERSDIWHRADSAIASALEIGLRVKKIPSAQQWIPCSERQPEKDGRYWVWCEIFIVPDHVDEPCSYYGSREASYLGGHWYGDSIGEVVAWMELPEAWKGSEDEEC